MLTRDKVACLFGYSIRTESVRSTSHDVPAALPLQRYHQIPPVVVYAKVNRFTNVQLVVRCSKQHNVHTRNTPCRRASVMVRSVIPKGKRLGHGSRRRTTRAPGRHLRSRRRCGRLSRPGLGIDETVENTIALGLGDRSQFTLALRLEIFESFPFNAALFHFFICRNAFFYRWLDSGTASAAEKGEYAVAGRRRRRWLLCLIHLARWSVNVLFFMFFETVHRQSYDPGAELSLVRHEIAVRHEQVAERGATAAII
jgi:hypothetical protein